MVKIDLNKLNEEFGIPNHVAFRHGPGQFPFIKLANAAATATLSLYGGQVLAFHPRGHEPVLWQSDHCTHEIGKAIRGGIPICWPWFGGHPTAKNKPAHGFARTSCWQVLSTKSIDSVSTQIQLGIKSSKVTKALWPHQFDLGMIVSVGKQLVVKLIVQNTGTEAFTTTGALHSYFNVSDITAVSIHGLDGVSYLDLLDPEELKEQKGPIRINAEIDRTYVDTTSTCAIKDPGFNREITISKKGSKSTVVWNPWITKAKRMKDFGNDEYLHMVCVETTNAHTDFVTVPANQKHSLQTTISVESIY